MMLFVLLMLVQVEWDLLVSSKESHEAWHSCGFNLVFIVDIEMCPGLIEVFVQVFLSFSSLESHMGFNNFSSVMSSTSLVHIEFSIWFSFWGSTLVCVVLDSV